MPRTVVVFVLLAAAVLATGCGGSSSAPTLTEYEQSVVAARDRVDFALARITKAEEREEFLNRMDEASAAINNAASGLEDSGAAEGFGDETEKLTDALRQLSVDLSATAHDLREPEGESLATGASGLNFESWDQANLALASLIGQGIDVELIGRH